MKNKISFYRQILFTLLGLAAQIKTTRENLMAYTSLQMARCWTGRMLAALGADNPYKAVETVGEIPDMADQGMPLQKGFDGEVLWLFDNDFSEDITMLDKVNYMREVIGQAENTFDSLRPQFSDPKQAWILGIILQHLAEAKMAYGLQLHEMRPSNAVEVDLFNPPGLDDDPVKLDVDATEKGAATEEPETSTEEEVGTKASPSKEDKVAKSPPKSKTKTKK